MESLLKLFGVQSYSQLSKSDKKLVNDLINSNQQNGGGYSMRPDLGEINGMSPRTGYEDNHQPIFVGELLRDVAGQLDI